MTAPVRATPNISAPELHIRKAINDGVQIVVATPGALDSMFESYGEDILADVQAFFAQRNSEGQYPLKVIVNYPRPGITLPIAAITLSSDSEAVENDLLADYAGIEDDQEESEQREVLATANTATYNIMLLSQDPNLTLYLYMLVKAILILNVVEFTRKGMLNIRLGGNDIQLDPSLFPEFAYARMLSLTCLHYFKVPELTATALVTQIIGGVNVGDP